MNPARCLLLTGAGLTKNFGGFLASEMWARIYNRASSVPKIRSLMLATRSFEDAFFDAQHADYSEEVREALSSAIFRAYEDLDHVLREWNWTEGSPHRLNEYGFRNFIHQFAGAPNESGFIFTLNQDLLIERIYHNGEGPKSLIIPSVDRLPGVTIFPVNPLQLEINPAQFLKPIESAEPSRIEPAGFHYVKLHGSYGWAQSGDLPGMLIGGEKEESIQASPLLSRYFQVFEDALSAGSRRLLVIGYGWHDDHINRVIAAAIEQHGLEVFILGPNDPFRLSEAIREREHGEKIVGGIRGFFATDLKLLFPPSQETTQEWNNIRELFFGAS